MHPNNQKIPLNSLARKLVTQGFFTEQKAAEVITQSITNQISFITYLIKQKLVPLGHLARLISQEFDIPLLELNNFTAEQFALQLVSEQLIRQHNILPLSKKGNLISLALADPTNQAALDEIKFHTGLKPVCFIAAADQLDKLITQALHIQELANIDTETREFGPSHNEIEQKLLTEEIEDAPLVRYVNNLFDHAIKKAASDIHLEPYDKSYRIRFRIDGILYEMLNLPNNLANKITARIKIMAQMDIAERRIPQDGRLRFNSATNHDIDFRVSTCPTIHGEKVVIRILDSKSTILNAEALGFDQQQKNIFYQTLKKPQGLILVTGPTGSGKTITLYTALNMLNTAQVNILTVEDPVEIHLFGINQVHINPKAGLTFATVLRAFLRQDPDILMVGEMRDLETAEIGIKAAQTGHLVLSTLHTNCAAETLTRLISMGISHYNLATSAILIIAQRLARKLCDHCKYEQKISATTLVDEGFSAQDLNGQIYAPLGCDRCTGGYNGRIGIFEFLEVTATVAQFIMHNKDVMAIAQLARNQGMSTLRESALMKVKSGVTSLAEINRVTK